MSWSKNNVFVFSLGRKYLCIWNVYLLHFHALRAPKALYIFIHLHLPRDSQLEYLKDLGLRLASTLTASQAQGEGKEVKKTLFHK